MNAREWMRANGYRPSECEFFCKTDNEYGDFEFFDGHHAPRAVLESGIEDAYEADGCDEHVIHIWSDGLFAYDKRGVLRRVGHIDDWEARHPSK